MQNNKEIYEIIEVSAKISIILFITLLLIMIIHTW